VKLSLRGRAAVIAVLAAFASGACDGKDPSGPPATPLIQLAVGATSLQLQQGATGNIGVTITREGGFSGPVTISAEGLPAGVTAPAVTIEGGQTQGVLALTAEGAAAPTTANVTIRASGSGVDSKTATVALTLQVRGSFTLGAGSAPSLAQGASATVPVSVTRTGGFIGSVALTATAPAGITAALSPTSLTGTAATSTLTIAAAATVAPGTYPVTVTAQTPGLAAQNVTVNATVTVAGTYTLLLTPSTLSMVQGTNGTTNLAINRQGGFNGAVALTATAPTGITATITPASVTGNEAAIAVAVAGTVAPGNHTVTIRGATPGLADQTVALTISVTTPGSFSLALAPSSLQLVQGTSGTASVNITRAGAFTGSVNLTAAAPAGLTASVAPAEASGAASVVTVSAGAATAPGDYTVTITGKAANVADQTATLNVTITQAGAIALSLTPPTLSLQQGASGSATVGIARTAFSEAVALTATAPAGITATLSEASVTGNTSTLNVAVGAGVTPGDYTITVRGTGTGIAEQTASLGLTVTAAPAGSFSIALTPSSLAINQGGSATSNVAITRTNGYAGAVAFSATGAPNGVSVSFDPASAGGNNSTMTVDVGAGVTTGTYSITVNATGPDAAAQTTALSLTVNEGTTSGGNVTWTFCGFSGLPTFVAAQDGDGPWIRVTSDGSNEYSFQISSGRGGISYVTPGDAGGWDMQTFYGTTAELQVQGEALCSGTTGAKTVTGTATGLNGEYGWITLGSRQVLAPAVNGPFTMSNVSDGPLDLVTARAPVSTGGFGAPTRFSIQRNLNPANNGSLGTVDLSSGFAPVASTVTFANLAGGEFTTTVGTYLTPRNTLAFLFTEVGIFGSPAVRNWYGFPSAQRQAGELHVLEAVATDPAALTGSFNYYTRQVRFVTAEVGPRTATLGPVPATPTVSTVATAPYVRFRVEHTINSSYNRYFVAFFNQGTEATERNAQIQKTNSYVEAGGPLAMEVPDLSSVSGWSNDWGMRTGAQTFWGLTATGWTGSGITSPVLVDGATLLSGTRNGLITP